MLGNKTLKSALVVSMLALAAVSFQASAACNLVSTKDGSPLNIKVVDTDTPEIGRASCRERVLMPV